MSFRRYRQGNRSLKRLAKPRFEVLESRCLLATYTWNGPENGLWSQAVNWLPNGVPGPRDTVLFGAGNVNSSRMDIMMPIGQERTVSVLNIGNYTGTIKLQGQLIVDVLDMSNGTIAPDVMSFEIPRLTVRKDGGSFTFANSRWTGGNIGGGMDMNFWTVGGPSSPLIFDLGGPVTLSTPTFSGAQWLNGSGSVVQWLFGDVNIGANRQILNREDAHFIASSSGTIRSTGARWEFTNDGTLTLYGDRFQNVNLRNRKTGRVSKREAPGRDGGGMFSIEGDVSQEGTLQIDGGSIYVTGMFTQQREFIFDPSPLSTVGGTGLSVDGNVNLLSGQMDLSIPGQLAVGGDLLLQSNTFPTDLNLHGNHVAVLGQVLVDNGGGVHLQDGILTASNSVNLYTGVIRGPGMIMGDVHNSGRLITSPYLEEGFPTSPSILYIIGNYSQSYSSGSSRLWMNIIADGSQYDQFHVDGTVTLGDAAQPTSTLYVSLNPYELTQSIFPDFVTYGSISGTFTITATLDYELYAVYGTTSMTLTTTPSGGASPSGLEGLSSILTSDNEEGSHHADVRRTTALMPPVPWELLQLVIDNYTVWRGILLRGTVLPDLLSFFDVEEAFEWG